MKRDIIDSLIIGFMSTYLPVFDITGAAEHLTGMLAIGILVFMGITAIKKEPHGGRP